MHSISIILSLSFAIIAFDAWFDMLENFICRHRADRFYMVELTRWQHQPRTYEITNFCRGQWHYRFDQQSQHHARNLSQHFKSWGVQRAQK